MISLLPLAASADDVVILDNAPIGIAIVCGGNLVWTNLQVRRWLRESAAGDLWLGGLAADITQGAEPQSWLLPMPLDLAMDDGPAKSGDRSLIRWLEIVSREASWEGRAAYSLWISDVSEREQLRGGLEQSEVERETILDNALMGLVLISGRDNIMTRVNPAFEVQMLGYSSGELRGKSASMLYASKAIFHKTVNDTLTALRLRNSFETEFLLTRKDGTKLWVRACAKAVDVADIEKGVVWGLLDISESKSLLQKLDRTLREREAVVQTSMVGIAIFGNEDAVSWVNRTLEEDMLGYAAGGLIGKSARDAWADPSNYEQSRVAAQRVFRRGGLFERDVQLKRADGSKLECRVAGKLIDAEDPSRGVLWFLRDVTAARRLEQALDQSRIERETILRSAQVGIVLAVFHRLRWVNDAFAAMLGHTKDDMVGQSSRTYFVDAQAWLTMGQASHAQFERGESYECEIELLRKGGERITAKVYGRALNPQDMEQGAVWTFVDITELKRAELGMRTALQRERELSELKTRFVAMTSHEFRTPLAAIGSAVELLQFYGATLDDKEKVDVLTDIKGAVRRMTIMLEDVLTMSRIEAGLLDFRPARSEVKKLTASIVGELESIDRGKHLMAVSWAGNAHAIVDEKLLRHAVTNLLTNALKYTPAGGTVTLMADNAPNALEIRVRDTGMGIPEADLAHLFEMFHRAGNVGNIQGTGLGLAIAKEAIKLHNGTIDVSSQVGKGTEFIVRIPNREFVALPVA
jgi:PAS domain S-box-containing protein